MKKLHPIEVIIDAFGSKYEIARICDVERSVITRWTKIPVRHMRTLIDAAADRGIELTLDDLVP